MNEREVFEVFAHCQQRSKKLQYNDCKFAVIEKLGIPELSDDDQCKLRNCFDKFMRWRTKLSKQGISAVLFHATNVCDRSSAKTSN